MAPHRQRVRVSWARLSGGGDNDDALAHDRTEDAFRELFGAAPGVARVFPRRLEQFDAGAGAATLDVICVFKGSVAGRSIEVSWERDSWRPKPTTIGRPYLALLRAGDTVSVEAGYLAPEFVTVDPIPGVTDRCQTFEGTKAVSCEVFTRYGQGSTACFSTRQWFIAFQCTFRGHRARPRR